MIGLPLGTLPVDFLTLFMALFRNLAENQTEPDGRDQGFQATIMKSSADEVREKEMHFFKEILTMFAFRRITVLQSIKETQKV